VHSDLKPENILLTIDEDQTKIVDLKIIDFGSVLFLGSQWNISTATPELVFLFALLILLLDTCRQKSLNYLLIDKQSRRNSNKIWSKVYLTHDQLMFEVWGLLF